MLIITAGGGFVNRFFKRNRKREDGPRTAGERFQFSQEERCSLCRGELYPGDPYFALEGRVVCEDCLGRFARSYFAPWLRWVGAETKQRCFDTE